MGLLLERPGYGYDVDRRLEERLGPAWRLPRSSVYGVLDALESQGVVRREIKPVAHRRRARERAWYYPTGAARAWFDRWMEDRSRKGPVRSELVAKLAVARPEHLGALRGALEAYERECLAMRVEAGESPRPGQDSFGGLIVCIVESATVQHLNAEVAWAREACDRVDEYLRGEAEHR